MEQKWFVGIASFEARSLGDLRAAVQAFEGTQKGKGKSRISFAEAAGGWRGLLRPGAAECGFVFFFFLRRRGRDRRPLEAFFVVFFFWGGG